MQQYPKRLIEVDLPIKRISAHARREKSIRHGHISTLHIWWARRPLAACRAVICASLWPDPADPNCPQSFRDVAAKQIIAFAKASQSNKWGAEICDGGSFTRYMRLTHGGDIDPTTLKGQTKLRAFLLDFIADFAAWEASTNHWFLDTARSLTQAAHEALGGEKGTRPLVVDPFAGGGAIPLEALRVGADAFASDLNPVAVLLNKVVLEYIPKYGQKLADEVRKWGQWVKEQAEKELAQFYPKEWIAPEELRNKPLLLIDTRDNGFGCVTTLDIEKQLRDSKHPYTHYVPISVGEARGPTAMTVAWGGAYRKTEEKLRQLGAKRLDLIEQTPIAYLWARTIKCEGPSCGAEVPLMRSLWLAKKAKRSVALRIVPKPDQKRVDFEIIKEAKPKDVAEGTVRRGSATCPCCGYTTPVASVRVQMKARKGGAHDARLFAVVTTRSTEQGRFYRLPTDADRNAVRAAAEELEKRKAAWKEPLSLVPDEPLNMNEIRRLGVLIYGMITWGELFTPRQNLALITLSDKIRESTQKLALAEERDFAVAVESMLALALSRQADSNSSLCGWRSTSEDIGHTYGRQALPMMWDFVEANVFSGATRDWLNAVEGGLKAIAGLENLQLSGQVESLNASHHSLPNEAVSVLATDPPYYDAVPYASLSDFFYVWLRRLLRDSQKSLFKTAVTPKASEIVVDRKHLLSLETKGVEHYEQRLSEAFAEGCRILRSDGLAMVVFASKTTRSWESFLRALLNAGFVFTASWPIDTEMETKVAAIGQARLMSSVHVVCRKRIVQKGREIGDWRDVLAELPKRTREWMKRLSEEGVVGADAIFACLGPALEIFSRYSRVEKASGEPVLLKEYLTYVWGAVAQEALAQIFKDADATGFEEDARLTAMWLWTLNGSAVEDSSKGGTGFQPVEEEEEEMEEDHRQDAGATHSGATHSAATTAKGGYVLEFDAARKIAQGLGAHLEQLTSVIEVKGDKARLLGVAERTKRLFGKDEAEAPQGEKRKKKDKQMKLWSPEDLGEVEAEAGGWGDKSVPKLGDTTLDRIHQSMILFAAGRGEALRRFLVDDGAGRDQRFWKLANALSALYPQGTDEKRWVDGVLARKKGLGL